MIALWPLAGVVLPAPLQLSVALTNSCGRLSLKLGWYGTAASYHASQSVIPDIN